jgi:D-glycero-D-manno-heptose 1,7-bisphosphate phosphatase
VKRRLQPAVFLDRDGTIIHDRRYLKHPEHIRYYKGSFEALKALQKNGYALVIVTNQSGVGRGFFGLQDLADVHGRLGSDLCNHGIRLKGIYVCPHHPDRRCACRKPRPRLYWKAARDLALDMKNSYLVGDRLSDVEAAPRLGARGILIQTGLHRTQRIRRRDRRVYRIEKNLAHAARWILKGGSLALKRQTRNIDQ